jgi:hypothetical protein
VEEVVGINELSVAQLQFAERERAQVGLRGSSRGIFLYRQEPWGAYRWLVAPSGRAVEMTRFLKGA